MAGLRLRHGHRPDRDAEIRDSGPAGVLRERFAVAAALRICGGRCAVGERGAEPVNWAEAFSSVANDAIPVLAAIGGSSVTYWFSELKAKREAKERALKARDEAQSAFFQSRYHLYERYIASVASFGVVMNGAVQGNTRLAEIKSALDQVESALLAIELLASEQIIEPARELRDSALKWADFRADEDNGFFPYREIDKEKIALVELMRSDLEKLRLKLGQSAHNMPDRDNL